MISVGFSTCKTNLLSRAIRWFTKSKASHTWLLVEDSFMGYDMVMQATEGGFQLVPYESFKTGHDIVAIVTPKVDINGGVQKAVLWLGEHYDYFGLVGSVFVLIGRWLKRKVKNPLNNPHGMFCSEAVVYVLQAADYPGSKMLDPSGTTPQDLLDFLNAG